MSIEAGQQLAQYRLIEKIGEGGMGVVWKAVDTTLDREVAIKALPAALSQDPERLARFEREAKLLASLNHPNIATVHGLHRAEGVHFLAMELVAGEDLATRVARGAIPVAEAVAIARSVALGVGAAHASGVIHRDLKPANVLTARGGTVKVLDFGLATAFAASATSGDPAMSPTMTSLGTQAGTIMGTAAYMAPEQARGELVDKRADIFAFGCLLYEMLTGQRAFGGRTISDSLAAVLRDEPDLSALPDDTPPAVRRVLARCLRKDLDRRFHDIADARIELDEPDDAPASTGDATAPATASRAPLVLLGALALVATVAALALWLGRPDPPARHVQRLTMNIDSTRGGFGSTFAIAPDESRLVYVGNEPAVLNSRALDSLEARAIPGTEEALAPFFSPDGAWLGFVTNEKLRKMPVVGGPIVTLCDVDRILFGATWARDGTIYYSALEKSRNRATLFSVPDNGGTPRQVLEVADEDQGIDFLWPVLLPGERSILYTRAAVTRGLTPSDSEVRWLDLDTREERTILSQATYGLYAASGHVIGVGEEGVLKAVPFDASRGETTGAPVILEARVALEGGVRTRMALSERGMLIYASGDMSGDGSIVWYGPGGKITSLSRTMKPYRQTSLSPDGSRIAFSLTDDDDRRLWVLETATGREVPVSPKGVRTITAIWTPDGDGLIYSQAPDDGTKGATFVLQRADGTGEPREVARTHQWASPVSISPDGASLRYAIHSPEKGDKQFWTVPLDGGEPRVVPDDDVPEVTGTYSPNGKLIAHETGPIDEQEVYVRSVDQRGDGYLVSTDDGHGHDPRWSRDGTMLYYTSHDPNRVMRVPMTAEGVPGTPERVVLVEDDPNATLSIEELDPDGRILAVHRPKPADQQVVVVLDWFEELERLVARR